MTVAIGPSRFRSILHVHTLPIISGSGINTLLTMKASRDRGFSVALACATSGPLTHEIEKSGMRFLPVSTLQREIRSVRDLAAVFQLARIIRREGFDLVHTHNSKGGFVGRLAARLTRTPLVVHTVHGFAFHDAESPLRRNAFRVLERAAAHWCHGMIFISQPLLQWALSERIGLNLPKVLIYSGIDIRAFMTSTGEQFRRDWEIEPGRLLVGIISKLWEGKGHDVLLTAWKMLIEEESISPTPLLLVVGEGTLERHYRKLACDLNLDQSVRFIGFQADIPSVTAALDVSVLPSLFEGMGRVILEAMAAGKPVVASNVGGIPDLIRNGENGFLVPPGNAEALCTALRQLLLDDALRLKFSRDARASLRPEHTSDWMVERIHAFYDELWERRIRRTGNLA